MLSWMRGRFGRLIAGLFAVVALLALVYFLAGLPLARAREAWRSGRHAEAERTLSRWARLKLRPAEYDHLGAVVALTEGRLEDAQAPLERLAKRSRELFPVIRKEEVARELIARGRFEELLRYDATVRQWREPGELRLLRAAAQAGLNRTGDADATLASLNQKDVDPNEYAALRETIAQRKQGSFPLIFDRTGKAIAIFQIDNSDLVAINRDFAPLIERAAGALTFESRLQTLGTAATIETTLDPVVQRAAVRALGGFRASLVAIDLRTNELLAVASGAGGDRLENVAFEGEMEPGSIVKLLTAMNLVEAGLDPTAFFPAQCEGVLQIDGKVFYDWAAHGEVRDLNEALATSCNSTFAKIGMKLGGERVDAMLRRAGFGESADLGVFVVPLGSHRSAPKSDYDVAAYAVGLQNETTNALHVAMIGAAVANRGTMTTPRLLRGRRSILGRALGVEQVQTTHRLADGNAVRPAMEGMQAAVVNPRGTGRRAVVAGVPIALKTGTSGTAIDGYDAVIVAYAPVHDPRIAIGIMAENAGPAEYAGATMAHDFFTAVADRLR